ISEYFSSISFFARQYDRAIEEAKRALELDSHFFRVYGNLGSAYLQKGEYEQAIAALRKAVEVSGMESQPLAHLAYGLGIAGRRGEAREILASLKQGKRRVSLVSEAAVYLGLGETDQA